MSRASELLRDVAEIVAGARNATHGDKERSFACIAQFWNAYKDNRKNPDAPLSARDVAQMLVLLKIARSIQGEPVLEHFMDEAGYAGIAGELAEIEKPQPTEITVAELLANSVPVQMTPTGTFKDAYEQALKDRKTLACGCYSYPDEDSFASGVCEKHGNPCRAD